MVLREAAGTQPLSLNVSQGRGLKAIEPPMTAALFIFQ
jgi:hypothetical protein